MSDHQKSQELAQARIKRSQARIQAKALRDAADDLYTLSVDLFEEGTKLWEGPDGGSHDNDIDHPRQAALRKCAESGTIERDSLWLRERADKIEKQSAEDLT